MLLFYLEQGLNGVQFGVMLFLMAAGLTLVFGIMNLINLAHGSLYMLGAYFAATMMATTGSLVLALIAATGFTAICGYILEVALFRALYRRDPLDQVLCTFGIILFLNEVVRIIWGSLALPMDLPPFLAGNIKMGSDFAYPTFRLVIILAGLLVAVLLFTLIARTRLGMRIRAGASDRAMIGALGVNIRSLYSYIFALGAALAGLAGFMAGPILAVQVGMGDTVLVLALVVIVIGGVGSVRGAFIAALLVGLVDTFGRVLLPAALADIGIYAMMAAVLFVKPEGLFPARG
jgi:branched-chain amino acid transport system permease protein